MWLYVPLLGMMEKQNLQGYLIPRADEYQSEYLPKSSQRLAWLTGFDGSAGFAIVLKQRAAIFTDGRYTLQIRDHQTDIIGCRNLLNDQKL